MDKRLDFTGGNPDIRLNQILIDAEANRPALFAILASFAVGTNPNFIIDGCVASTTSTTWSITAGYIFINDEIVQVDSQSGTWDEETDYLVYSKVTTYNPLGDITYIDGTPRQTWQVNRGVIAVGSSPATNVQLDAVFGDSLEDKLRVFIGQGSTTQLGLFEKATTIQAETGTTDKAITADLMQTANGKAWQTPSYNAGFADGTTPLKYRINRGKLEFRGNMTSTGTSGIAFVLPVGYRPTALTFSPFLAGDTSGAFLINTSGEVYTSGSLSWNNIVENAFNSCVIID